MFKRAYSPQYSTFLKSVKSYAFVGGISTNYLIGQTHISYLNIEIIELLTTPLTVGYYPMKYPLFLEKNSSAGISSSRRIQRYHSFLKITTPKIIYYGKNEDKTRNFKNPYFWKMRKSTKNMNFREAKMNFAYYSKYSEETYKYYCIFGISVKFCIEWYYFYAILWID